MKNIREYPLTIITAPIGYRKIMHIQKLGQESGIVIEWYDENKEPWRPDRRYEQETWVVLKNYDKLTDSKRYYSELIRIVEERKENLKIILINRSRPKLSIETLKAKYLCQVIDEEFLKFTNEEIISYFEEYELILSEEQILQIQEYSEGWPAIIYFIRENYLKYTQIDCNYSIHEFIRETIYNKYEREHQNLLLFLASIGEFKLNDFKDVKRYPTLLEGINRLLEDHVVRYDSENEMYRFNNVVKEFLKEELEFQDEKTFKQISQYTGEWYWQQDEWGKGCNYWLKSGNYISLLENLNSEKKVILESQLAEQLLEQIERVHWVNYPIAYLRIVYLKLLQKDRNQAKRELEQVISFFREVEYENDLLKSRIEGEIALIETVLVCETIEEVKLKIEKASQYIPKGSVIISIADRFREYGISLSSSYQRQIEVLKVCKRLEPTSYIEIQYLIDATYYLYTGEWKKAENCSLKLYYKADIEKNIEFKIYAQLIRARIAIGEEDKQGVAECMKVIDTYRNQKVNDSFKYKTQREEIYIRNCLANLWGEEGVELEEQKSKNLETLEDYMLEVEICLRKKEFIKADMLMDLIQEKLLEKESLLGWIYYYLFRGIISNAMNERKKAEDYLYKAFEKSSLEHIVLPFKEHSVAVRNILEGMNLEANMREYINQILGEYKEKKDQAKVISLPRTSGWKLTEREWEIVNLVKQGLTNKEIASRLFIAHITVGKTISNIYRKIQVSNRIELIAKLSSQGYLYSGLVHQKNLCSKS